MTTSKKLSVLSNMFMLYKFVVYSYQVNKRWRYKLVFNFRITIVIFYIKKLIGNDYSLLTSTTELCLV